MSSEFNQRELESCLARLADSNEMSDILSCVELGEDKTATINIRQEKSSTEETTKNEIYEVTLNINTVPSNESIPSSESFKTIQKFCICRPVGEQAYYCPLRS